MYQVPIPLRKSVFVSEIVDGLSRTLTGMVVGVSRMHPPRYDVLVDGKVLSNLPAERVREVRDRNDIFGTVPR